MQEYEEIIIKYLDKTASQEEINSLNTWIELSEENKKYFNELCSIWHYSNVELSDDRETEAALLVLKERIAEQEMERPQKKKTSLFFVLSQVAAIALIVLNLGYIFLWKDEPSLATIKLMTAENSKGRFVLPDSTIVWLNANTILEYPENFIQDARRVKLNGEAYFEVKKNKTVPFMIEGRDANISVLGTSFLIQNYENKNYIETVLIEGSILLTSNHFDSMYVAPNDRIFYSIKENKMLTESVNTANYISWINDKMIFDNANLKDIITNLEKWYGVEIECDEKLANSVSLSLTIYREPLNDLLRTIQYVAPMDYKIEEHVVYINPKK